MEELLELLNDIKEDVDFENEKALVDDHILDSFDILQIISDISDEFDIVIPAAYVKPENFNSAEALWTLSCASNPPAARIQPSATVPTPEPTFIQKEEAAFPIPAVPYPLYHSPYVIAS